MAAELRAKFILALEDKLSSGIGALVRKLEALGELGRKLNLGGLEKADRAMDALGIAADRAGRKVEGIGRSARSAMAELRRLSTQPIMVNGAGTAFLPPGLGRTAMAAAIVAAAAGGGGGGRLPTLRDAPFMGGASPLLLGGPGGGIPLNFNPRLEQMAGAWRGLRMELGRTALEAQRVGRELGQAGHAALAAAATGFGIYHTVRGAAEVDQTLRQAAIAQGLSGPAMGRDVSRMLALVSGDATRTGQSLPGLAEAYGDLVARGLPPSLVDELIKTHSTAATAYHINPVDLGQTVYSLNKTLGIGHEEMGGAIAALAQSTHAGSFKMGDFARYIPNIAGQMKQLGWTGRGALDSVAAMIEMTSHQSGTAEQTATDFQALMDGLTAKYTVHSFKKIGIDLPARMAAATKAGKNPVDAYLDILEDRIKGITDPLLQGYALGDVLHNRQAGAPARAILQQRREQRELTEQLHAIGADKLTRDFQSSMEGLMPQLMRLQAEWQVFEMRLGMGFAHLIGPAIDVLHAVNSALAAMDGHLPGVVDKVLSWGGGLAVVSTALGVLLPLFRAMGAGLMLVLGIVPRLVLGIAWLSRGFIALQLAGGPILWLIELLALGAILLYLNWDKLGPMFERLWEWIKSSFWQFVDWVSGWVSGSMQAVIDRLRAAWSDLRGFFSRLWRDIVGGFDSLIERIQTRIDNLRRSLGLGGPGTAPDVPPPLTPQQQRDLGTGMFQPSAYRPGMVQFQPIDVRVRVEGPGTAEAPRSIRPIDRGSMLGRT